MKTWMRALLAVALAASATQLSCNVNDYCLNCGTSDGGGSGGDGGIDDNGGDDADVDAGCVPSGSEVCDGKDNDCNGLVDDGVLPSVGDLCANQLGVCAGGVQECVAGELKCNKQPSAEVCDMADNNCNGTADEGDPGGGGKCGTDMGECIAGTNHCNPATGQIECYDFVDKRNDPEQCDAKDNDCDGNFDENIGSMGNCGPTTDAGQCTFGQLMCQGGSPVCQGAVFPQFETCNNLNDDCDAAVDEIFNKQTDPRNCGSCGNVCPTQPNANTRCSGGTCGYTCKPGFHDLTASPGCEYGPCFASGAEECDGLDNDCDNRFDEGLTPPAICRAGGECGASAPTAQCTGNGGWVCMYPGAVEFPEVSCDGLNNDCDANVDESHPNLNQACTDGRQGECESFGTFQCNTQDPDAPTTCVITDPGQATPDANETCDNRDNDCDGDTDEGAETGSLIGQEWVDIGGGKQMMKYEASKPDATGTDVGTQNARACSRSGVLPWTNIKYPDAVAACASVGATLCSEAQWHRTCSVVPAPTFPIAVSGAGTLIEAEEYSGIAFATGGSPSATRSWVPDYTKRDLSSPPDGDFADAGENFSGISAMEATPNLSGTAVTAANAPTQAPRLDYSINFTVAASNYHIWARVFANGTNDNVFHVGVTSLAPPQQPTNTVTINTTGQWVWVDTGTYNIPIGQRTISVFMGEDGVKVDRLYVVTGTGTPPTSLGSAGNKWAYATNPNTYQASTCNGDDLDTNAAAGDQDDILTAGSLASCRSTVGTGVFDLSGNVKEWTLRHQPGENPIRGGASNNTGEGISCPLNFTLADDTFFFPNIGFRCCRNAP